MCCFGLVVICLDVVGFVVGEGDVVKVDRGDLVFYVGEVDDVGFVGVFGIGEKGGGEKVC